MISIRRRALELLALVTLSGALTAISLAHAARGPSTPEERAKITKLVDDARKDPLTMHAANGAWFEQWVNDVPDFMFKPEGVAKWCMRAAKGDMKKIIQFQFTLGALGHQIAHSIPDPTKPADVAAVNLAALESVLAAYEVLLAKDPANRSPKMDEALLRRSKGELAAFAGEIAQ
jgi:hypothetical protein